MRFPLALTAKIAAHIVKHKIKRTPKFALVLQLEPLHTCNLTCTGCGRIREYSTNLKDMMPLEDCLAAARECDAPMVSICGGEPLIYPKIEELGQRLAAAGPHRLCLHQRHVHAQENEGLSGRGVLAPNWSRSWRGCSQEKLITDKDLETIRKGKSDGRPVITPDPMAVLERSY